MFSCTRSTTELFAELLIGLKASSLYLHTSKGNTILVCGIMLVSQKRELALASLFQGVLYCWGVSCRGFLEVVFGFVCFGFGFYWFKGSDKASISKAVSDLKCNTK